MQRFAVIGLGRFGSRLAANLASMDQEVIGIDRDERLIEELRDRVTLAVALDATDEQALRMHAVDKVDVAVVGIGNDFEAAALATVTLKQVGVPRVISRAVTPTGARILARIGADEVVNPEDESADRWASRLLSPQFLSQHEVGNGQSIVELKTPEKWVGQSLAGLKLRERTGLHVVAIKQRRDGSEVAPASTELVLPDPARELQAEDVLLIMGDGPSLAALPR